MDGIAKGTNLQGARVVFMGTPDFAVASLAALHGAGATISLVVTPPDRRAGRGLKLHRSAVKEYAAAHGLPILQPVDLEDGSFISSIRSAMPDVGVVVAFRKLPSAVWRLPRLGTFNLHASLLPQYRGAAPIQRAVMNGEMESGVTTFLLDEQIDTGAILLRKRVSIAANDTAGDLHDRLMGLGAQLVVSTVRGLMDGSVRPMPQPTPATMRPAPKIFRADCRIDWSRPAQETHNHIRGLSPHPGAWCVMLRGDRPLEVKLFDSRVEPHGVREAEVRIASDGKRIVAPCGSAGACISIGGVQLPGKRRMLVEEFVRGLRADEVIRLM